jgi:hypothetical protein
LQDLDAILTRNYYNKTTSPQEITTHSHNTAQNSQTIATPTAGTTDAHTSQTYLQPLQNQGNNHHGQDPLSTGKLHISRFIDNSIKPNTESKISLPPELESLTPLIMSQPEVLASHICELGHINLTHIKAINKKKNSYQQLTTHNKIPRSLRIKCELTTSPSYSSNPKFLQIRESLQNATNDYIKTGITLMTEWTEENILLLLQDCCHAILKKALQLLDGIVLYNAAAIPQTGSHPLKTRTCYSFLNSICLTNL